MPAILHTMHTTNYYSTTPAMSATSTSTPQYSLGQWLTASFMARAWTFLAAMVSPTNNLPDPASVHKGLMKRGGDGSAMPALVTIGISVALLFAVITIIACAKRSHAKAYAQQRRRGARGGYERRRPRQHESWYGHGRGRRGGIPNEDLEMGGSRGGFR